MDQLPPNTTCEIPPLFHSLELGGPFTHCLMCKGELIADISRTQAYLIERIFRQTEPIIEYAVCLNCLFDRQSGLSTESVERLQTFWNERVDIGQRATKLLSAWHSGEITTEAWTDHCVFTGKPLVECNGHQVIGLAYGHDLLLNHLPLMLSDDAAEAMAELLSEQTKGWMDDFVSENFGMPPEFLEYAPIFL